MFGFPKFRTGPVYLNGAYFGDALSYSRLFPPPGYEMEVRIPNGLVVHLQLPCFTINQDTEGNAWIVLPTKEEVESGEIEVRFAVEHLD